MWHPDCFHSHVYHLPDPTTTKAEIEQEGSFTSQWRNSHPSLYVKQNYRTPHFIEKKKKKTLLSIAVTIADEHRKKKKKS